MLHWLMYVCRVWCGQIKESQDADERRKQLTAWYWVFYLLPRQVCSTPAIHAWAGIT